MNTSAPKVSIGMPIYNGEKFLEEVLDCILGQSFADFELIISDNASQDRSQEICEAYAAKDNRVCYKRNLENIGAAKNFNRVFELSRGDYFKWAAADDLMSADYFERCVEVMENESDVVVCYPKTKIIDEQGRVITYYEDGLNMVSESPSGRFLQLIYNCRLCNPVLGVIRSSVLRKTPLLQDFVGSDKVLLAELCLMGKFREIPEYLFGRRFHLTAHNAAEGEVAHGGSFVSQDRESQLNWLNPKNKKSASLIQWRKNLELIKCLHRSPVRFSHKVMPYLLLNLGWFADRNYRQELMSFIKRKLTGGIPTPASKEMI